MKKALLKIIKHYGVRHQQRKLSEEVFELQEAISNHEWLKSERGMENKTHIIEEIGDVLNVVEQFMYFYEIDVNDVIESKHRKVDRQLDRMKEE